MFDNFKDVVFLAITNTQEEFAGFLIASTLFFSIYLSTKLLPLVILVFTEKYDEIINGLEFFDPSLFPVIPVWISNHICKNGGYDTLFIGRAVERDRIVLFDDPGCNRVPLYRAAI